MVALLLVALLQQPAAPAVPATPPAQATPYKTVEPTNVDVQAALKAALIDQKKKTNEPLSLVGILTAERATIGPGNIRVCLSANRSGVTERAQVVVSRDAKKKKWELQVWAWGSCR